MRVCVRVCVCGYYGSIPAEVLSCSSAGRSFPFCRDYPGIRIVTLRAVIESEDWDGTINRALSSINFTELTSKSIKPKGSQKFREFCDESSTNCCYKHVGIQ